MTLQALMRLLGEQVRAPTTIERLATEAGLALGELRIHGVPPRDAWFAVLLYAHRTGQVESLLHLLRDHLPAFRDDLVAPVDWPLTSPNGNGPSPPNEIVDFSAERRRHERIFLGRGDVLAELDRLVSLNSATFVLLLGSPGMGKSAIALHWLDQRLAHGEPTPHHFLRRGHQGWDDPAAVRRNLAAQVEALYPAQCDPKATVGTRLDDLFRRVSENELLPADKRLVLLVDGLDEASKRDVYDNPVERILPYDLPDGIVVVCTSRPKYPDLGWLMQRSR